MKTFYPWLAPIISISVASQPTEIVAGQIIQVATTNIIELKDNNLYITARIKGINKSTPKDSNFNLLDQNTSKLLSTLDCDFKIMLKPRYNRYQNSEIKVKCSTHKFTIDGIIVDHQGYSGLTNININQSFKIAVLSSIITD